MLRKVFFLFLGIMIIGLVGSAIAEPKSKTSLATQLRWDQTDQQKLIKPNTPMPERNGIAYEANQNNLRRDPIGEITEVGNTYYDYQHNGTISKQIAIDTRGGIHVTWMKSFDAAQANRRMMYNCLEPGADEWLGGVMADNGTRAGYGHIALLPADGRGVVFSHSQPPELEGDEYLSTMSVDFDYYIGAFTDAGAPTWPDVFLIWPKGAISQNNTAHMLATENTPPDIIYQRVAYWYGEAQDRDFQDWAWTDPPICVDTASAITTIVSASRLSDKVVMAWHHNRVGADLGPWDAARGYYQRNNDIRYVIMEDGESFDPDEHEVMSMTKIKGPDPDMWDPEPDIEFEPLDPDNANGPYGDLWRPYCDVDIQLDPWDDEPFGVFAACAMYERPWANDAGDITDGMTGEHNLLWFWNSVEDTITLVANGYYFNRTNNGGTWHSRAGGWRMNADRGSIAFDPENEGTIYITWVNYPQICVYNDAYDADPENEPPFLYDDFEFAADTSADGYSNAEIMLSKSDDYGIHWSNAINITNTHWEGEEAPEPGECQSEAWQSVAVDVVDGALHLLYVNDADAGGVPQDEGATTNNPVIYQKVLIEDLDFDAVGDLELPYAGFTFHNYPEAQPVVRNIVRDPGVPITDGDVEVSATVTSGGEDEQLTTIELIYLVNGGNESTVQMENAGGDKYTAVIPAQGEGTEIYYQVRAVNTLENEIIVPRTFYQMYTVRNEDDLSIYDVQYRPELWENASDASPYVDYEVSVTGIVTTGPEFNDAYGAYAIQEARDLWSGMFVRGIEDDLELGTEIRVTGIVMERDPNESDKWQYATYIDVVSYEVVSENNDVNDLILPIETRYLNFSELGEELEGIMVNISAAQVDTLTDFGAEFHRGQLPIRDASSQTRGWLSGMGLTQAQKDACPGGGFDSYNFQTEIQEIVGVVTESYGHYAITPRTSDDLTGVGVDDDKASTPEFFNLNAAYPNPFNGITAVSFNLSRTDVVNLAVFDINGRMVMELVDGKMNAGYYEYSVDASALSTGVYILRLETPEASASQKLVLVK